jgi:hypothetical protein
VSNVFSMRPHSLPRQGDDPWHVQQRRSLLGEAVLLRRMERDRRRPLEVRNALLRELISTQDQLADLRARMVRYREGR